MHYTKTGDQIVGTAQAAVGEKLDTLESKVDDAIESTVHELRNETQKTADQVLTRWIDYCEKQIPKIEAYITSHPWQVLGGLVFLGYLFSGSKRTRGEAIKRR